LSGCAPWWTNLEAILVEKERKREKDSASPTKPSRHFPLSDSQEEKPDPSVQKKNSEWPSGKQQLDLPQGGAGWAMAQLGGDGNAAITPSYVWEECLGLSGLAASTTTGLATEWDGGDDCTIRNNIVVYVFK
jgi:hypothetical protein